MMMPFEAALLKLSCSQFMYFIFIFPVFNFHQAVDGIQEQERQQLAGKK